MTGRAQSILPGVAQGQGPATAEPISFWGGVDPATGLVIDVHHPLAGQGLAGCIPVMPGTRGPAPGRACCWTWR